MLTMPYDSPRRGASTTERPFGEFDACIGGWQVEGEPYTKAPGTILALAMRTSEYILAQRNAGAI